MKGKIASLNVLIIVGVLLVFTPNSYGESEVQHWQGKVELHRSNMERYHGYYKKAEDVYHKLYSQGLKPNDRQMIIMHRTMKANLKNYKYFKKKYQYALQKLQTSQQRERQESTSFLYRNNSSGNYRR